MRAFLQYFLAVNAVNFIACLILSAAFGFKYFPVCFCTFGLAIGLLVFRLYFNQQYYFYFNLGFTKAKLIRMVFISNLIISVPLLLVLTVL